MNARAALILCCLAILSPSGAGSGEPLPVRVSRESTATKQYESALSRWKAGQGTLEDVHAWSVRLAEAQVSARRSGVWQVHRERMATVAQEAAKAAAAGTASAYDADSAEYFRMEAEDWAYERR